LVGSVGGNLTVAACLDIWGAAAGGAATLGCRGCDICGGGVAGTGAAAATTTGVTDSAALGVSSTTGAALAGVDAPSNHLLKHHTYEINY
jgi:hypothetical protein